MHNAEMISKTARQIEYTNNKRCDYDQADSMPRKDDCNMGGDNSSQMNQR